jgi:hypothetical protein
VVVAMVSLGNGSKSAKAAAESHKGSFEQAWLITTPAAESDAKNIGAEIAKLRSGIVVNPIAFHRLLRGLPLLVVAD